MLADFEVVKANKLEKTSFTCIYDYILVMSLAGTNSFHSEQSLGILRALSDIRSSSTKATLFV